MEMKMKIKIISILLTISLLVSGCSWFDNLSRREKAGAGIGALSGGLLAVIASDANPWKAAVLGTVGGAIVGGLIGNILDYAAKDSASKSQHVKYYRNTKSGDTEELYADPIGQKGNYKEVNIKYYRNGKFIGEEVKTVPQ